MFKVGQKVCVVSKKHFFEEIENGAFRIATISEVSPSNVLKKELAPGVKNYYYQAKADNGDIFMSFEYSGTYALYEFITLDYLRELLERRICEKRQQCAFMEMLKNKYT